MNDKKMVRNYLFIFFVALLVRSINLLLIFTLAQCLLFSIWLFYDDFSIDLKQYLLPGLILIFIGLLIL